MYYRQNEVTNKQHNQEMEEVDELYLTDEEEMEHRSTLDLLKRVDEEHINQVAVS